MTKRQYRTVVSSVRVMVGTAAIGVLLLPVAAMMHVLIPGVVRQPWRPSQWSLDDLVVGVSAALGCVLVLGLACCLGAALLEAGVATVAARRRTGGLRQDGATPPGHGVVERELWRLPGTPAWARRFVFCACGLGLVATGVPGAAAAADVVAGRTAGITGSGVPAADSPAPYPSGWARSGGRPATGDDACPRRCLGRLDGLPLPDLPATERPAAGPRHRVRPGESLWSIAASQLPPAAADADIARRVTRLYVVNRDVIGPDPDLIFPGMLLVALEASS